MSRSTFSTDPICNFSDPKKKKNNYLKDNRGSKSIARDVVILGIQDRFAVKRDRQCQTLLAYSYCMLIVLRANCLFHAFFTKPRKNCRINLDPVECVSVPVNKTTPRNTHSSAKAT